MYMGILIVGASILKSKGNVEKKQKLEKVQNIVPSFYV
jgi:hypothetical protein